MAAARQQNAVSNKRPNIVFIMSDDHSANAISAYSSRLNEVFRTPNIDRLAEEGALAENCHCTNAICTPSRATILTGQHSHTNGVRTLYDPLPDSAHSFVEDFQAAGYQTAVFGKWHLHSRPKHFDDFRVLPGQGLYIDPLFIGPEDEWPDTAVDGDDRPWQHYPTGSRIGGHVTDVITDLTLDWLTRRDEEKPFLLFCHHKAPHDDFEYAPRYENIFDGVEIPEPDSLWEDRAHRSDGSRDFGTSVSDRNSYRNAISRMSRPDYPTGALDVSGLDSRQRTKAAYQKYLKDYLRCVRGIDDGVGRILDYLDQAGLRENTIVIYTSDQGMFLGEHDYIDKRWIFEEALRMPFLVRYPVEIPAGARKTEIFSNVDFAQTLLDFAGIKTDAERSMQGRSFRGLLSNRSEDENRDWPNLVYNRYWMHMAHHQNPAHYGIRTLRYKLIFFYGLPLDAKGAEPYVTPPGWELYDLEKDPFEVRNLYEDPAYASIVGELTQLLLETKEEIGDSDEIYPDLRKLFEETTRHL